MDASTVSRRLNVLEASLATTLFDRGRDGVALTDAARYGPVLHASGPVAHPDHPRADLRSLAGQ